MVQKRETIDFSSNSKFTCQTVVHERQCKSLNDGGNLIGASISTTVKHTTLVHNFNVMCYTMDLPLRKPAYGKETLAIFVLYKINRTWKCTCSKILLLKFSSKCIHMAFVYKTDLISRVLRFDLLWTKFLHRLTLNRPQLADYHKPRWYRLGLFRSLDLRSEDSFFLGRIIFI